MNPAAATVLVPVTVPCTMGPVSDAAYERVLSWAGKQGLELYPHQDEAIIELLGGSNVVLATPTGSGKSLVAMAAHAAALAGGRVSLLHGSDQGAGQREVLRATARSSAPRTSAC